MRHCIDKMKKTLMDRQTIADDLKLVKRRVERLQGFAEEA